MTTCLTNRELASRLPNIRGSRGVHVKTVDRRVAKGELPPYDWKFSDGTRGWNSNGLSDPRIASFVSELPTTTGE